MSAAAWIALAVGAAGGYVAARVVDSFRRANVVIDGAKRVVLHRPLTQADLDEIAYDQAHVRREDV